jgi:hypothetical protein
MFAYGDLREIEDGSEIRIVPGRLVDIYIYAE